jgi:hypothetical protein
MFGMLSRFNNPPSDTASLLLPKRGKRGVLADKIKD